MSQNCKNDFAMDPLCVSLRKKRDNIKDELSTSKQLFDLLQSTLKIMNNAVSIILNAFFVLSIFKFLGWLFNIAEQTAW